MNPGLPKLEIAYRNERFTKLTDMLADYKPADDAVVGLHQWLTETSLARKMHPDPKLIFGSQTRKQQTAASKALAESAALIREYLPHHRYGRPLEEALYEAFYALRQIDAGDVEQLDSVVRREWIAFRTRVRTSIALLERIATVAHANLNSRRDKSRRPSKAKRDALFTELFERLSGIVPARGDAKLELALKVWALHFGAGQSLEDMNITSVDAARAIVKEQRRENRQGKQLA